MPVYTQIDVLMCVGAPELDDLTTFYGKIVTYFRTVNWMMCEATSAIGVVEVILFQLFFETGLSAIGGDCHFFSVDLRSRKSERNRSLRRS